MADRQPQALFTYKEGWLSKTGSNNRGWKDRHFILSNGKLSYYKSDKKEDNSLLGTIDLREVNQIVPAQGRKGNSFDIHTGSRIYNVSAKSLTERDEWIASLKQSLQVIQKHGISVSQNSSESSGSTSSSSVSGSTVRKAANSFSGSGGFLRRKVRHTESNNNLMEQEDNMVNRSVSPSTPGKKSDVLVNSLLEAEVDVLRKKVSELEGDLEASDTQRKLIEHKASENKTSFDMMVKQLNSDISILKSKVSLLEESKLKLESVNDSLTAQIQEKDDTIAQNIEDMNELENDIKHWQEEAVTTKERLEEVEEVFEALQNRFKSEQGSLNSEREKCHKLERELNEVKENFNNLEKEKDRVKAVLSLQKQRSETTLVDESELKEEKLQLQLKLENLKLSMNEQIKEKELEFSKEKNVLTSQLNQSIAEKDKLNKDLQEAVSNYSRVEGQIIGFKESLRIAEENNKRLQMEKEKATSDLITIRKSLKEKEKVSTDEDSNQSSSNGTKKGSSPTFSAKLADAESRAEMATRLLQEIQSERDFLKAQLSKRCSPQPSPSHSYSESAAVSSSPPIIIIKSQPTVTLSSPDVPPPKPKRPPKELLDQIKL